MAQKHEQQVRRLLEKKLAKLSYQMELAESYLPVIEKKLNEKMDRRLQEKSDMNREQLLEAEFISLSNELYVERKLKPYLEKFDEKRYWQKRSVNSTAKRKHFSEERLSLELQKIDDQIKMKIQKLTNKFQSRKLNDEQIKENLEIYHQKQKDYALSYSAFEQALLQKKQSELEKLKNWLESRKAKLAQQQSIQSNKLELLMANVDQSEQQKLIDKDSILKLDHLTMQFGGLKAVDDLSFEVKRGEIFGLIGPNGAGKTTVFNCITQFYKSGTGNIYYRNHVNDVILLNQIKVHNVIKQGIVRTFQNVELIWELSVLDNMLVGAHSTYRSGFFAHSFQIASFKREEAIIKAKAEKILKDLDILDYKDFYPIGLPYGTLKKIELARTLMSNPDLIILDEPAAGLNDAETEALAETIKKIQTDYHCTIFLVEHDMGLVMSICDTICAISFGKILAIGTPKEIQTNKLVQEAYLGGE